MDCRSRDSLRQQKGRAQGTLNFRSTKKLLQLQQKDLPSDSKTRRLLTETKEKIQKTWPPAHDDKPKTNRLREKLPEKLLLLEELYHSMEAAISLLRIRHDICTFSTITAAVESSTRRRFLRSHLAQIKYILPEALLVEEHISWDAESQCSRRDLRITLLPISKEETVSMQRYKSPQKSTDMVVRRQEFHRRLLEFHYKNKESDVDVPQASMFGGVAAASRDAELPEPSPAHHKDKLQKVEEACTSHEKDEILQNDYVEPLNAQDFEPTPLPIGFYLNQLKKYPRSPSKLRHQQRVSPAPLHSMSHLPSIFKPHFSSKRHPSLVESDSSKAVEEAILQTIEKAIPVPGIAEVKLHFSIKRCKKGVVPPIPDAPPQQVSQATTPKKGFADFDLSSPQSHAATMQKLAFMSPTADLISRECTTTPAQNECPSFTSPLCRTPACTPQQAILTPSAAPATPSVAVSNKEDKDIPVKRRKQAVMKSLRFGTPTKHVVHDKARLDSSEQTTPPAVLDVFLSPIKTPAGDLSFAVTKKPSGNVSRVLPFNSPLGKIKEGRLSLSHEEGMHTPKRVKLSCPQISELEPSCIIKEDSQAEKSESILRANECGAASFVDLTPITGADNLSASDVEILKCLPQHLLNDVQAKERKQLEDKQSRVEETRRRQQLIAGLPNLFNMVRLIFQSGNRTVLMCKDLTKMVLSSHPDITDQGEIVEQLQLLVELAPEWISVNRSSTGDSLYRINKTANMRAVSKALVEAK